MEVEKSSWKFSFLSIGLALLLTFSARQWQLHSWLQRQPQHHQQQQPQQQQWSQFPTSTSTSSSPKIDDDITRDEICRRYLYNFLNGTTDAKDECDVMYHAFEAADCSGDELVLQVQQQRKRHPTLRQPFDPKLEYLDQNFILDVVVVALAHPHKHDDGNITDDHVVMDDYYQKWTCCTSIYHYYTRHCHQPKLASTKLLGLVLIMIICSGIKGLLRTFGWDWIPDSAACIVVGAIAGGSLRMISTTVINEKISFNNDLFLRILLPPIVFQSALSIDKKAFRRDLFPILMFAIFGTGFSAIVIGFVTKFLTEYGGTTLSLLDSLLFGSLISSIDPVATLGILQGVGVNPTDTLYTIIFGESLLNDGVAIVLFETLVRHLGDHDVVNKATFQETLARFSMVSMGSIAIGLACGMLCTIYFMALRGKHSAVTEVAVFFCWALVPYYISDGAGLSGIIAIMAMGFFMDYFVIGGFQSEEFEWMDYMEMRSGHLHHHNHHHRHPHDAVASSHEGAPNSWCHRCFCCCCHLANKAFSGCGHLSSRSRKHVGFVTEVVASIMETAIFAYLGLFLFQDHSWNLRLSGIAIFGCVLSRSAMVVLLSLLINFFVWIDFENQLSRLCRSLFFCCCCNKSTNNHDDDEAAANTIIVHKPYLDQKTQCIILLAGIRGAVSFALVENIPVYDAVTKHGSKFKAELKAMTASSILITLFVFGALTYFTFQGHRPSNSSNSPDNNPEQVAAAGPLTQRLLSGPLTSTIEDDDVAGEEEEESESDESSSSDAVTERRGTASHRRSAIASLTVPSR